MSVLIFELKKEHVLLLKNLDWSLNKANIITGIADEGDAYAPPFGTNDIYEGIDLILNGKTNDYDPLTHEDMVIYSDEQKAEWDELYSQLPMALSVVLFNGSFELGTYKTRYHFKDWKKV